MKNLINLAVVILVFTMLTGSIFGQQGNGGKNIDAPKLNWVDSDGDGICDNVGSDLDAAKIRKGKLNKNNGGNGLGDGSGIRPQDGSGYGKKTGDGICIDGGSSLLKRSGIQSRK